jgi:hypothetical protein
MLDLQFHESLIRRPRMRAIDLHHAGPSVRFALCSRSPRLRGALTAQERAVAEGVELDT